MTPKPKAAERGMTLIEVMVAVVVLAITAAGLTSLSVFASRGLGDSGSRSTAMDIALARAELLSLEGPDALVARACPAAAYGCLLPSPNFGAAMGPANCSRTLDAAETAGVGNGKYRIDTMAVNGVGAMTGVFTVRVAVCWVDNVRTSVIETRRMIGPRDRG